jgi:dTDP-4-amino-4,6-dideoxygalactose transaminase
MEIPFQKLDIQVDRIKEPFLKEFGRWLSKKNFILDENVERFERSWARFCQAEHCVGVSSGADAIYLALMAIGVGPGDEVITQGNAYNASVTAIMRTGATPRFADIEKETLCMSFSEVEKKINENTKAILFVHLYGFVPDLTKFKVFNIPIVEDCAQAHGTELQGDIACFSFYPTKSLGGFGDSGAVVTDNSLMEERVRAMRNLGQVTKNHHDVFGSTMRMDSSQALWLNLQLPFLLQDLKDKKLSVYYYDRELGNQVKYHNYYPHIYPIFPENRGELQVKLSSKSIGTAVHYPVVVYKQPFFESKYDDVCPISEWVCDHELSLPLFIGLTGKEQREVISNVITI